MEVFAVASFGFAMICLIIILGIVFYFLPSILAGARKHKNTLLIFILNLLFGWTAIGWLVCLIWAFVDTNGETAKKLVEDIKGDKYEKLEKLKKLKDDGAITEEEFEKEKSKLLN